MVTKKQKINYFKEELVMENGSIFLKGVVQGRSKKYIESKNGQQEQQELVTYKVNTGEKNIMLKHWEPKENYFAVGEVLDIPITVKVYLKDNQTFYDYTVYDKNRMFGEEF